MAKREPWNPLLCSYPESDKVNQISIGAETLFTRLIAKSDDQGNYDGDPMLILCGLYAKRFKAGKIRLQDVKRYRSELIEVGLVKLYNVNGSEYLHIVNCKKHLRSDIKADLRFPSFVDTQTDTESGTDSVTVCELSSLL